REKDRTECRATMAAMTQADSSEHMKEVQTLERLYAGRLKGCEDTAAATERASSEARSKLQAECTDARTKLTSERDEQKKLAEERATALEAWRVQREKCDASLASWVTERDQHKASLNAATAEAPSRGTPPGMSAVTSVTGGSATSTATIPAAASQSANTPA